MKIPYHYFICGKQTPQCNDQNKMDQIVRKSQRYAMRGKKTKLINAVSELREEDYSREPELNDIYQRLLTARRQFAEIFEKSLYTRNNGDTILFSRTETIHFGRVIRHEHRKN